MNGTFVRGATARALAAVLVFWSAGAAQAQQGERGTTVNLRGEIAAFERGMLTVRSVEGETVAMSVPAEARISSLTRVAFETLKKGDFIASAGLRQSDGTLKAIDVRIFPAGGRRPPEVHRKYRLGPESTMTNATVDAFVGGVSGRTFKVKYKGGEQTIVVPKDALVMRQDPGATDLLKPGAKVSVVGSKGKDGKIAVVRAAVGMNGLMPPT
jgi:hypothetical protein